MPHGREGYYFGASGEYQLYDAMKAVAEVLHTIGKGQSPEPTTFTPEELHMYFGGVAPIYTVSIMWISILAEFAEQFAGLHRIELTLHSHSCACAWMVADARHAGSHRVDATGN